MKVIVSFYLFSLKINGWFISDSLVLSFSVYLQACVCVCVCCSTSDRCDDVWWAITAWCQFSCKVDEAGGVEQRADKSAVKMYANEATGYYICWWVFRCECVGVFVILLLWSCLWARCASTAVMRVDQAWHTQCGAAAWSFCWPL